MADLESRVAVLEAAIGEIRAALTRIEDRQIATISEITSLRVDFGGRVGELRADLGGKVEYLRGRVEMLPTTWVMLIGIIGGQVALAGLIGAVAFGAAHLVGRL